MNISKAFSLGVFVMSWVTGTWGAVVSNYGQIQNVQNYSANPFYNPNNGYAQKFPQPVYVTGPDVSYEECMTVINIFIQSECDGQNFCATRQSVDITPAVITYLSQMPERNFLTSCAGYIDTAFTNYVKSHTNLTENFANNAAYQMPGQNNMVPQQINNTIRNNSQANEPWRQDIEQRKAHLAQLRANQKDVQTSVNKRVDFPTTYKDLSFIDRMAIETEGFEVFKDMEPYDIIDIKEMITKLEAQADNDKKTMTWEEYCQKYAVAEECNPAPGKREEIIHMADRPAGATSGAEKTPTQPSGTKYGNVTYSKKAHDGPCTPSDKSNHYTNKILTTGKYESIDPAFEKMMIQMFRTEGGCANVKGDAGGYTCYGISQNGNPDVDFSTFTRAKAEDLTYDRYYKKYKIDTLPDYIRGSVLRAGFGSGPVTAIKRFQKLLGLPQTGKVDNKLVAAAENYSGDLHNDFWDDRQRFFVELTERKPSYNKFLKGWMNGVKLFRANGCHVDPVQPLTRENSK